MGMNTNWTMMEVATGRASDEVSEFLASRPEQEPAFSDAVLRAVGEAAEVAGADVRRCGMVVLSGGRPLGGWAHIPTLMSSLAAEGIASEKLTRSIGLRTPGMVPVVILSEVTGGVPVVVLRHRRLT